MKWHGVGQAAHVARDDGDGAELAHGAGIAEKDAVEQRPADIRQGHGQKGAQPRGAERQGRLFVGRALLLHQRDELAGDERKGHEDRGEHDARQREDDLDAVRSAATGRASPCAPNSST